jgi:nitric oxide reductase NorD protein
MTLSSDLITRYSPELRGFGASLPDDFSAALATLESSMSAEDLERWAQDGILLANASLRSWEAAAEYFRATPQVLSYVGVEGVREWVGVARRLAEASSLMAAAFLKSTPDALGTIGGGELETWASQGERLCRGNWKSIALSALYFQVSPQLLRSLPLGSVGRLVDIVDQLTERSYELANTCLESSPAIFASLAEDDREPFLRFARAVTRASWADTRLYFDRGPRLLEQVAPDQRATFLDLASRVTTEVGRQGFPLFADAAESLSQIPPEDHAEVLGFSARLVAGSPTAAMEYVKTVPFVRTRLTDDQLRHWQEAGLEVLTSEHNPEGAEAYFRLESTRAEEMMRALSSRVELGSINSMLRMYAKALSGEQVAVLSAEELAGANIGWVNESAATTEGSAIYLPPFVATFEEQAANFQVYKVYTTHQTARMEFGSFRYRWARDGAFTGSSAVAREVAARERRTAAQQKERGEAITSIQRYFNCFDDRTLISGLFTIVEDTRIDSFISREYGGIRRWLRRLQEWEADRRPSVQEMGLRTGFVENLLRSSLGRPDTIMWPVAFREYLQQGIGALKVVEQEGATVQDSAEVAAALYDIAMAIPNVIAPPSDGKYEWEGAGEEMLSMLPAMPSGADGPEMQPNDQEMQFENPPQPEFRGDFKPELVQLLARLKNKTEGDQDGAMAPLTKEQLKELLENSVELSIAEWAEGDIDQSLGMFLENMESAAQMAPGDQKPENAEKGESTDQPGGGDEGAEGELPVEIDWFYYDEWDFRAGDYKPRWNRVGERFSKEDDSDFYEETLRRHHGLVMETRKQFEMMRPESFKKIKRLEDGEELDLDLAIEFTMDKRAGTGPQARIYNRRNKLERDVAVAFLLDMSASTDEEIEKQRVKHDASDDDDDNFDGDPRRYFQWLAARRAKAMVEPPKRIIDLEKESSVLIVEALEAIGDAYGIYGFSGYGRDNVEFHVIKELGEEMDQHAKRRIGAIEPIRSTRMGPAIRHTIHKLQEYDAKVKILIMVSDGRPQDHGYGRDRTEKEYAVHDTKQALNEAKRLGITPFLITVDKEGHDYLKQMCDDIGYEVVDDIESLPRRLPTLYRHLAAD